MIDGIVYFHRNSGISSWFSTLFITRLSIRSPSVVRCSLQYCFLHHGSGSAITRPRIPVIYNGYIVPFPPFIVGLLSHVATSVKLCCLTLCMQWGSFSVLRWTICVVEGVLVLYSVVSGVVHFRYCSLIYVNIPCFICHHNSLSDLNLRLEFGTEHYHLIYESVILYCSLSISIIEIYSSCLSID